MPPWVASVPRLTTIRNGRAIVRLPTTFRCHDALKPHSFNLRVRSASTQVSPIAINLRPNIPPRNKELHDALSALSGPAETYVNLNRLQLALSGVAAQDAVTRVAILGLNDQVSAQRLARLLLADPLGAEEQWEKELAKVADGNERAVLLKYGDEADSPTPTPLHKVLSVPSRVLRSHNLEILISTLNVTLAPTIAETTETWKDSVSVPKLQASSTTGVPVPFPVHKTLILGQGIDGAIAYGRFSSDNSENLRDMVKLAIELPAPEKEKETETVAHSEGAAINVQVGTEALATFRESIQNSIAYEHGWYRSGLPALSAWLIQDVQPSKTIKPVLKSLVSSVVDDTEAIITKEDLSEIRILTALPTSQEPTSSVMTHLESWAEKSHTELRDHLDAAFATRSWHKLAWWKLLWRVDDVTMISTELLERGWLVSAEKDSIYLAGRMNQLGYPEELHKITSTDSTPEFTFTSAAPTIEQPPSTDLSTEVRKPIDWPDSIPSARTDLIKDTIPPLQALAQRLILQTLSTTSISTALSALIYVSVPSFSLFEAAAVGVLGLTFSLRRMQKLWEGGRESWQGTVREEGRRTLKTTEEVIRMIIRRKEAGDRGEVVEGEGVKRRREAREAVRKVREALDKLDV